MWTGVGVSLSATCAPRIQPLFTVQPLSASSTCPSDAQAVASCAVASLTTWGVTRRASLLHPTASTSLCAIVLPSVHHTPHCSNS